jgi:hypothetical protein
MAPNAFMRFLAAVFAVGAVAGWGPWAEARTFANSYLSFDLPSEWACTLEGTEWVSKRRIPRGAWPSSS